MPTVAFNPGKPLSADAGDILRDLVRDGAVAKTPSANFLNVGTRGAGGETQKFRFVTPPIVSKWGVGTAYEGRPQKPTLKMDVAQNGDNKFFYDAMRDHVEPALLELAIANASEFVKKPNRRSADAIKSDFGKVIKPAADERYAPTISFKIPLANGTPEAEWGNPACWNILVQDANGEEVPKSRLNERNLRVIVLTELKGLVCSNTGISIQLNAIRVRIVQEAEAEAGEDAWGDCEVVAKAADRKRKRELQAKEAAEAGVDGDDEEEEGGEGME